MSEPLRIAKGAALPPFEQEVRDKTTGELVDFSDPAVVITFRARNLVDGTLIVDRLGSSPQLGVLSAGQWQAGETANEGFYAGWFLVDHGAGSTQETEEDVFEVYDHVPQPAPATPSGGPCQPWITAADVDCSDGVEDEKIILAAQAASDILFALSARQFTGLCTNVVRPCLSPYYCGWARRYAWAESTFGSCSCGWLSEVILDGDPIVAVTAVKVDGVTLDPSVYRLDAGGRLVRLDGISWPACQDLVAADTEVGTWSVTYAHGMAAPAAGILAAKELACEIIKAQRGEACRVPSSWTRLSRQGVELSRNAQQQASKAGTTGMPLVDLFLSSTNPHGLLRRPAVWSPDLPAARRPA